MAFVTIKQKETLEIWGELNSNWVFIKNYPFTACSGQLRQKVKEGVKQIPEGIYEIEYLNPYSLFYLSLKISYPNEFDKPIVEKQGRSNLGGDIFIHGKNKTVEYIPIGDDAIEEVFYLASKILSGRIPVYISPIDFRKSAVVG